MLNLQRESLRRKFLFQDIILLHEKFLQFDWLTAVVFQLNLKYLPVKNYKPFAGSSINK